MDKHQMRKNERFQFVYELTKRERKGALFVHPGWMYCAMYNIATHLLQHIKPTCEHSQIGFTVLRTPGECLRGAAESAQKMPGISLAITSPPANEQAFAANA